MMLSTDHDIESFVLKFEGCTLPRAEWTHHAHLVVALWYLTHHSYDEALEIVRKRIRAYNEAVGTHNTDTRGYHETLTRMFLMGVAIHIKQHTGVAMPASLGELLQSPLGNSNWPLQFYTKERLFSVAARHDWVEPDNEPLVPGSIL